MKKIFNIRIELDDLFKKIVTIENAAHTAEAFSKTEINFVFEENDLNLFLRKNETCVREKIREKMFKEFRLLDIALINHFNSFQAFKKAIENTIVKEFLAHIELEKKKKKLDFAMSLLDGKKVKK